MLNRFALYRRIIAAVAIFVMAAGVLALGGAQAHQARGDHPLVSAVQSVVQAVRAENAPSPCHNAEAAPAPTPAPIKTVLCQALCGAAAGDHVLADVSFSSITPVKAKAAYLSGPPALPPIRLALAEPRILPLLHASAFGPVYLRTQRLLI